MKKDDFDNDFNDFTQTNNVTKTAIEAIEKQLPVFDTDLKNFTICSALSLNTSKFYSNFSLCCLLQDDRDTKKQNKVLNNFEKNNMNLLYMNVVSLLLGNKIIYN